MQQNPPQYAMKGNPEVNYGGYGAPPPQAGYPHHAIQGQPMSQQTHTTVVVQQPTMSTQNRRDWNTGTFDCCEDMGICLCGTFCGLCMMCQLSGDMGESMCVPCCLPAPLTALRVKWRTQNHIDGSIMGDCLMEACCGPCAACQLAREVKTAKSSGMMMH